MKKILIATLAIAAFVACSTPKPDGYSVTGTITGAADGQAIITNSSRTALISDTTDIKGGKFTFTGKVTTPENYILVVDGKKLLFFLDNSAIVITGTIDSLNKATVTGSKLGEQIQAMNKQKEAINEAFDAKYHIKAMMKEYYEKETTEGRKKEIKEAYDKLEPEMNAKDKEIVAIDANYIKENPKSPYTVLLLQRKVEDYKVSELSAMVDTMAMAPGLAGNRLVVELQQTVTLLKSLEIGQKAPDFTQNTPADKPVSLSSVYSKNKITMIDFWASWCGPCRKFNPTLVKIYGKYHKKGFEIFATSFDKPNEKDKWEKAIKDDKLTWIHVSDLQYWNNAAGKLYYIHGIPSNVFVDQNGTILAKKLTEEEIEKFLDANLK